MKHGRKGFTVVELVIVIAAVAILAAVLIPTFSAIVQNANISADTQAVRNMNVVLTAESGEGTPPAGGHELIVELKENGFSEFRPQTKFYTFYWIKNENVIVLADEAGDAVFPEEYANEHYDQNNWINLEDAEGMKPLPTAPSEDLESPRKFTVSVRKSGGAEIDFDIPETVTEGEQLNLTVMIPDDPSTPDDDLIKIRYRLQKVTVLMQNGEETHKIDIADGSHWDGSYEVGEGAEINIPCVTGNIDISISFKEFCCVTITNPNNPKHMKNNDFKIWCEKNRRPLLDQEALIILGALNEGYRILSATAYLGDVCLGDVIDTKYGHLINKDTKVTGDTRIEIETERITHTVQLIFKDQDGKTVFDETKTIEYNDDTDEVACSFTLTADLIAKGFEFQYNPYINKVSSKDELKPQYEYDSTSGTVNVSNINYDFTLTYFVKIPE